MPTAFFPAGRKTSCDGLAELMSEFATQMPFGLFAARRGGEAVKIHCIFSQAGSEE
jgi:hypothetical protein